MIFDAARSISILALLLQCGCSAMRAIDKKLGSTLTPLYALYLDDFVRGTLSLVFYTR